MIDWTNIQKAAKAWPDGFDPDASGDEPCPDCKKEMTCGERDALGCCLDYHDKSIRKAEKGLD